MLIKELDCIINIKTNKDKIVEIMQGIKSFYKTKMNIKQLRVNQNEILIQRF